MRTPVRTIIQLVTELVSPPKIFPLIIEGLKTKNSRQRTECLQVLEQLFDTTGMAATTTPAVILFYSAIFLRIIVKFSSLEEIEISSQISKIQNQLQEIILLYIGYLLNPLYGYTDLFNHQEV